MARSPIKIYSENPNKTAPQTQQQQPTNKKGMDRLAQSARRFIEQDDKLQLSVGEEKDVVSKVDVLCREIKEGALFSFRVPGNSVYLITKRMFNNILCIN